mgnify:FL=1
MIHVKKPQIKTVNKEGLIAQSAERGAYSYAMHLEDNTLQVTPRPRVRAPLGL